MTTRYKKLTIEDVDAIIRRAGLEWQNIGISPFDVTVGVATLCNLPEKGRSGHEIKDYAKFVSNRLEVQGAIMTRYDIPENRAHFKVVER